MTDIRKMNQKEIQAINDRADSWRKTHPVNRKKAEIATEFPLDQSMQIEQLELI